MLYVRDKDTREILKIVENYISLVWTERYQQTGDFVLQVSANPENIQLFRRGRYLSFSESEESMIIQTLSIDESYGSEDEDPILEIKGESVTTILKRRINLSKICEFQKNNVGTVKYFGSFSEICRKIANDDMIDPIKYSWEWYHYDSSTKNWMSGIDVSLGRRNNKIDISGPKKDSSRKIENVVFSNLITPDQDVEVNVEYTKLMTIYDLFASLSKKYVMGFRVIINEENNFEIQVYSGTDRTSSQKTLSPVIFNPVMDNITYVNYYEDDSNYKNYWYTYIDGYVTFKFKNWEMNSSEIYQGISGQFAVDKNSSGEQSIPKGLDRIEVPIFSSSISAKDDFDPYNDFEIGDETVDPVGHYFVLLSLIRDKVVAEGKEQFYQGEYEIVETSEGSIDPLVRYSFEKDYFIGDRVDITNANGIVMTGIIDEVVKSYDSDGIIVTPNFLNMTEYDYGEEE